ncbi:MAG: TRAP transporter small permease [Desulfobacterales bacterium]|nr:TRAP transporter small permease [Desulfobacterales bacterium]
MNKEKTPSFLYRAQAIFQRVEDSILVGLLLLLIGMAVAQIFLRNFFGSGVLWGDALLRVAVLWIGLVGAMVASRRGAHISIDVVSRYLPVGLRGPMMITTNLFTVVICAIACYYSLKFVRMEYEDGGMAFSQAPAWACEAVIPFVFGVVALRYILLTISIYKKTGSSSP